MSLTKSLDRLIGQIAYRLWDLKEGGVRLNEQKELTRSAYFSAEEMKNLQEAKLKKLLEHAQKTSPWYKVIMEKHNIDITQEPVMDLLCRFPITSKQDIRDNTEKFLSTRYKKDELATAKTGGSTGVSLNLFFDRHCQKLRNGAQHFADAFSGWIPGTKVAAIWGNPPQPKTLKQKLRAYLLERMIYLDTMDLNPQSMSAFIEKWRKSPPDMIFGHAHSIFLLAKFVLERKITDLRPEGIVATSMMLLDHERQQIESAFGCKVSNRYGCEEVGLIAVECEQHHGMHINSAHIILECVNDNGEPVPLGEPGKLVITDLNNFAMPLIRYRVEDVGVLSERQCPCGRTLPILERLEGRVADFLKKPDGGNVAGISLVERTLTKVPGVEQMQLVQNDLSTLIINRVKGQEYTPKTDEQLKEEFGVVFGPEVELIIRDVEKIPQENSGKFRFSICNI